MGKAHKSRLDPVLRAKVIEGLGAGLSPDEIGEREGVPGRRIRRYIEAIGLASLKPHQREFTFRCTARMARIIHQLAAESVESPAAKINQALTTVLEEGLPAARRKLGRLHKVVEVPHGRK